ncbi:uroporphyrinogen decarboxylase [candidate division KSB3 bacterium]|uniref:Uroporphyrinogen decarboxylase n=1 Tax=candidate division KSB3 bacterium TaxID=2044937 RepID=A0A9D5Q5M9_9BACT|nr:uroporphyrinogen decarboxylase [candidate division KSB3 bacterium]MBD3324508.1 uroporphyrinogen decarboxylase [candidate division KSB3 bacterium]
MTEHQWDTLCAVIRGEQVVPLPVGFLVDSPWLPNWAGYSIMEYLTSDDIWFKTNLQAIETFPSVMFMPGFWSEYGMCTEPSAFGAICRWEEDDFPFAKKVLLAADEVERLEMPDPSKDGLLPFVLKRLHHLQPAIEDAGHKIRFAIARGPLNVASFLMGASEFLIALKLEPSRMHQLLTLISDFLGAWIDVQREQFPTIDGILMLDDIVGFIGGEDFQEFGLPYLKAIYDRDVAVKCFHNDSPCKASAPFLAEIGINLLNFGVQHTLNEMKAWTGDRVALMGNIPPRDVLAQGTPEDVRTATTELIESLADRRRILLSCGGGMPPGAPNANIQAFLKTAQNLTA